MTSTLLGYEREYLAFAHLAATGYQCIRSTKSEGPFDIVAVRSKPFRILMIQVTSVQWYSNPKQPPSTPSKIRESFTEFSRAYPSHVSVELWCFVTKLEEVRIFSWRRGKLGRRRRLTFSELKTPGGVKHPDSWHERKGAAGRFAWDTFMSHYRKTYNGREASL